MKESSDQVTFTQQLDLSCSPLIRGHTPGQPIAALQGDPVRWESKGLALEPDLSSSAKHYSQQNHFPTQPAEAWPSLHCNPTSSSVPSGFLSLPFIQAGLQDILSQRLLPEKPTTAHILPPTSNFPLLPCPASLHPTLQMPLSLRSLS